MAVQIKFVFRFLAVNYLSLGTGNPKLGTPLALVE